MNRIPPAIALAAVLSAAGPAIAAEETVTLAVKGMYCSACPYIVKQSLAKISGVGDVAVSYEKQTAIVTYDDQKTTLAALTDRCAHASGHAGHAYARDTGETVTRATRCCREVPELGLNLPSNAVGKDFLLLNFRSGRWISPG